MATFSSKDTFLVYPTWKNFTQKKWKTCQANYLLELSLVSIIVYIYCLGKTFYYTYLKTTEHQTILPDAKIFHKKMCKYLVHIWGKKYVSNFSTLSMNDMKTKKIRESVLLALKYSKNPKNTALFTPQT